MIHTLVRARAQVGFENVFAFLWSTGRLAYLSDAEAFSSGGGGLLRFFLGTVLIPLWRDAHFYGAHRLIHFKPLFTHIHSLHHRNTDIEPFAGLCMHPVEHLYYYSCILPSIFFFASPFHLLWNGAHLLLAPGASHSGYAFDTLNRRFSHRPVYPSSACLSVRLSVLSVCLSACPSACLSFCLSVCLSDYLSVCLPVRMKRRPPPFFLFFFPSFFSR